ncbi:MAG: Hpt domain-containing protein [Treponema sp.]|uniref:Hpt domain-containing protein n=1 Tax=Treponema sp. TaxID=166 RepID=UPI0025DD1094|nr:Hpt domain-containing protein [Treponema sp.]MBQ9624251.1 Hpt domain-containing protein [Treponema sp.]MBR0496744.1 Hpt domain-containing protein [Treponema sp.]
MITLEILRNNGTDIETGLSRCLGKEDLYLKLVNMGLNDAKFEELGSVLASNDLQKAFELCHALKGVIGNLAITPLYEALSALTEKLRNTEEADYPAMYSDILAIRSKISGS